MIRKYLLAIAMTVAVLIATAIAYPHLPATVTTHWDINGRPNGFSAKWMLFLVPALMAGFIIITWRLPWLSPKQFEVDDFRLTSGYLMVITVGLLAYVDALILWNGLGHEFAISRAAMVGAAVFLMLLGNVMGKVRRNFYIGVRTPWALANERVWNATQRVAAKAFVMAGLAGVVLTLFGLYTWFLGAITAGALIPVGYSLYFYKLLERRGEL